jgi:hypothetical protein
MIIKDDAMSSKGNKHQSDDEQQGQQGVAKMLIKKRMRKEHNANRHDK